MKRFLAVYLGSEAALARSGWNALSDAERNARRAEGVAAWGRWVATHRASIVDTGAPLGRTKSASPTGIADTRNALATYTVVEAESHDAAARLFVDHPHFTIFPGDSVEIMECLAIPGA
ncbi:MAG: hypothetical protein HY943_10960 [Gammaproteobacteria bacterium]|nr:hypothetical protein [Gammaproteobacteria bacterium]